MESLPLIAKSSVRPNLDVSSLIREIFQSEFESCVPSKKLSENLRKSLEYERLRDELEDEKSFRSVSYLENLPNEKGKLMEYAENVFQAYGKHEEALNRITDVELNIMETQAIYLRREKIIGQNEFLGELLKLKRHPLMRPYDPDHVRQYKLLQGDSGLPPKHEVKLDFRMNDYQRWKKRVSSVSQDSFILDYLNKTCSKVEEARTATEMKTASTKEKPKRPRRRKAPEVKPRTEVFRAEPPTVCFTDFTPGEVYQCKVAIRNVSTKPMKFSLKPLASDRPFAIELCCTESTRILPGLGFKILVTFSPRAMDDENESVTLVAEDGSKLVIPLASYLEPPVLKTRQDASDETDGTPEGRSSSYIDCGACFPGDSKVTKIRFHSHGGAGEFFVMSLENWSAWHISSLTTDNFTDIPPFRLYPSYFSLDKNQVFDLYVEFKPPTSGLHADNIIVSCSNGEIRNLDILGDGVAWNRSFISFEDSLEKDVPPDVDDDLKAAYYLDVGSCLSTGHLERTFLVLNNSNMPFEFRWEMRDLHLLFDTRQEYGRLSKSEIKIEPYCGTFEPYALRKFHVSVNFRRNPIGKYRKVLSLYIIGLPYQSIEQASTIIRPSLLRGRFKSGSLFGEEENFILSPEMSYQGTYESVQESKKASSTETTKDQLQFAAAVCRKHPEICAIPLKKSKTFSNIGDGIDVCTCAVQRSEEEQSKNRSSDRGSCPRIRDKPNITELGSDLLWDFVDVLVDEVELWAEVMPTMVGIEPNVVDLHENLRCKESPMVHRVYVYNYNDVCVKCKWTTNAGKRMEGAEDEVSTLFRADDESGPKRGESCRGEWENASSDSTGDVPEEDYQITSYVSQRWNPDGAAAEVSANRHCRIEVEPAEEFSVAPRSRAECFVSVSADEPGIINRVLHVVVNDDIRLRLYVVGRVPDGDFAVIPREMDFGARRRGTRYANHFKIRNSGAEPLHWNLQEFRFDFEKKRLVGPVDRDSQSSLRNFSGSVCPGECHIDSYKLDARTPGIQCSLLRFQRSSPALSDGSSQYILVLGNVQTPELTIEAPRFNNAILAPSKTMYVGQTITQRIVLRNAKSIATPFVWGNPFGCHCKRLAISMCPKLSVIQKKSAVIEVTITPMEEGIVDHCYVPCFFSRSVDPVLLSVVGVVKSLEVSFELTAEAVGPCGVDEANASSVLRIPWPIKNFDPNIGKTHLLEEEILDFVCHCDRVEAEYERSLQPDEPEPDQAGTVEDVFGESDFYGEAWQEPPIDQEPKKQPCVMKYYTPSKMSELRRSILGKQTNEEDVAEETGQVEAEDGNDSLCYRPSLTESSTVAEYPKPQRCIHVLHYVASEIQFLDVLHKTASVRHFLIRNESPIPANFTLRVRYFARENQRGPQRRADAVKRLATGPGNNGDWEEGLMSGQPLLIAVSPAAGTLDGWESTMVKVSVFGNTWGEYRDFIICDIQGLPSFVMKVFVQMSGHPVLFPMFGTSTLDVPALRFDTVKYKTSPVVRNISVRNTSSIPITVTWMVFLTSPLSDDDKDEPFNLCLDLYTDKDSEDPDKTTKSSHNYLSKNTSGSVPFLDIMDKSSSRCTPMEPMSGTDSGNKKNGSPQMRSCSNGLDDELTPLTMPDSTKPEIQLLENYGKMDLHIFQICPRELDLEAYATEKVSITFDPNYYELPGQQQDFEAVATGCVRLRQEFAHYPDIYNRPCGKDYVSKLLLMSASVEKPLLTFDICRRDLKYSLNANQVLKTGEWRMRKKYLVANRSQTTVATRIRVEPGEIFSINKVTTKRKIYERFDPEHHQVDIEPGHTIQVELEAIVDREHVAEMYKKSKRPRERNPAEKSNSSELVSLGDVVAGEAPFAEITGEGEQGSSDEDGSYHKFSLHPRDSLLITEFRSKGWNNSTSAGNLPCPRPATPDPAELYGESWDFPTLPEEIVQGPATDAFVHIVREDVIFEQVDLHKQVLTPELKIFFPSLRIKPETVDFGMVYIGETARRYVSIINLTQYATEYRVVGSNASDDIVAHPETAFLRATTYKSDTGAELKMEFTPRKPGYHKRSFKIFGNVEMQFRPVIVEVWGYGTWNECYKYPRMEDTTRLPAIAFVCRN